MLSRADRSISDAAGRTGGGGANASGRKPSRTASIQSETRLRPSLHTAAVGALFEMICDIAFGLAVVQHAAVEVRGLDAPGAGPAHAGGWSGGRGGR